MLASFAWVAQVSAADTSPYPSLQRVLTAARNAGRSVMARSAGDYMISCPGPTHANDDRNPSLHVSSVAGKTLLNCFAGCDPDSVTDALSLKPADLFDEAVKAGPGRTGVRPPAQRRARPGTAPATATAASRRPRATDDLGKPTGAWQPAGEWVYVDDNGQPCGKEIKRTRPHERGVKKSFVQCRFDPEDPKARRDGWAPGAPGQPLLYRQPDVRAAVARGDTVVVAEGPKDADRVVAAGACGTSTSGGASTWHDAYTEVLTGAHTVWLVVDHDAAGYKRGLDVPRRLAGRVTDVRVMLPVPYFAKADASDHFDAGHGVDDFVPATPAELFSRLASVATYDAACWLARYLNNGGQLHLVVDDQTQQLLAALADARAATGVPVSDRVRDTLLAAATANIADGAPQCPVAAPDAAVVADAGVQDDEADDAMANLQSVPGSPAWMYLPGHGIWQIKRGELVQVLTWCPQVTRHLVAHSPRGEVTSRRVTLLVEGASATAALQDIADGKVWIDRFPTAAGVATRDVRDVLRNIVDHQAAQLPLIPVRPRWVDGRLVLPPVDTLPAGYGETAGTPDDFAALVRACAKAPRIALVMGLTVGGLYVEPLRRQSFIVHLGGEGRSGKTTALRAAAAIVGYPGEDGEDVVRSWSSTPKAIPAALRELAVLPGFRDELGAANLRTDELSALMFTIAQGAIRDASTRGGGLRATEGGWRGVLVSTGNLSIVGRIGNEGLGARIVEFDGAMTTSAEQAAEIDDLVVGGYGHGLHALIERAPAASDFGLRADKATIDLGVARGGPQRTLGLHMSLGIAGAQLLGEITGVPELAAAALDAARSVLAELVDDMRERGARPGDRLLHAIADAMAAYPQAFPTREQYSAESGQGQLREVIGWDLQQDDAVPGEVALTGKQLKDIARRAEIEDLSIALKDLKKRDLLHPDRDGRNNARVLQFPGRLRGQRAYHFSGVDAAHPSVTQSDDTASSHSPSPLGDDILTPPVTTSDTTSVTTSEQGRYDSYDAQVEQVSRDEDGTVSLFDDADHVGKSESVHTPPHQQSTPLHPQKDEASADSEAAAETLAPLGTEGECDVCFRPVPTDGIRHRSCVAFLNATATWGFKTAPTDEVRPCEHCGQPCRLWWGIRCLHAECQFDWFVVHWRARQRSLHKKESPPDAPAPPTTPAATPTAPAPPAMITSTDAHDAEQPVDLRRAADPPRALVAVADIDGIHLPDGGVQPLPATIEHIGHLADAALALRLGWRYDKTWEVERGQLWLTPALVERLGLPDKLPRDSDTKGWKRLERLSWLDGARHDGWTVHNKSLRAWTAVWRPRGAGALIVVPHWLSRRSEKRFDAADVDAGTLARRAQLFADTVGIPYRNSPGHTGLRLLRWTRRGAGARQLQRPIDLPVPARQHRIQADLAWHRPLTAAERQWKYVIGLDQNGCYINAANSLYVGADVDPVHVTGDDIAFSVKIPGYWRVVVDDELPALLPNPLDPTGRGRLDDGSYQVMSPTLEFLRKERKIYVRIVEAYVWPPEASVRFYDEWAAHLRTVIYDAKARAGDDADVAALLPTFKGLYTAGIGDLAAQESLLRPGDVRPPHESEDRRDPLWRPDHRHSVLARAQVGILRRVWAAGDATGMWPIAIHTDAVYYASNEPDPARLAAHLGLPFDDVKWGSFKPAPGGCAGPLTEELIEAFDGERGWGAALDATLVDHDVWQARLAAGEV